jgi:hypothetical protein
MFERVVLLHPWVILDMPGMRDPRLVRWGQLFPHQGGGYLGYHFTSFFKRVWSQTLEVFLEYPYHIIEFRYNLDMCLPPSKDWGDQGEFVVLSPI